ncbi:hypothetical protein Trydic_g10893 [Trypoxylus dichotomus]
MQISMEKTESMVIAKEPIRYKLVVNDKPICQCMQCTYLGVEITNSKNLQQEVRAQINKASRTSGYLRSLILSTESKARIYKTVVRPILTYAAETRADTTKVKNMMRAGPDKRRSLNSRHSSGLRGQDDDFGGTTSTE